MSSSKKSDAPEARSKPFSLSISSKNAPKKPSLQQLPRRELAPKSGPKKPSRFGDDDSDQEQDALPQAEEVTGFEAGGAVTADKREEKKPLVINTASKNDWRERVLRRKRDLLPPEVRAQKEAEERGAVDASVEVEGPSVKYGLSFAPPKSEDEEKTPEDTTEKKAVPAPETEPIAEKPVNQDDAALQALIRESKGEETGKRSNLIIPTRRQDDENEGYSGPVDEDQAYRADVAQLPEPATLDAYAAVPVEEFGAALLRGMGWKDGEPLNKNKYGSSAASVKPRIPERRPGFLGIGAKDVSGKAGDMEIGAWGKAAMKKARNSGEGLYTPVVMQNKRTGEKLTEEEFKKLSKGDRPAKDEEDWRDRRDRDSGRSGGDHGRSDRRDRDRERESCRHRDRDDRHRRRDEDRRDRDYDRRRRDREELSPRRGDRDRHSRSYRDREERGDRDRRERRYEGDKHRSRHRS
ncbi:hypothetical protein KEM55_008524 [Ascosphaera atra]|nr:hypothetical protein KEM55_008524 [Ascosphaera atra]